MFLVMTMFSVVLISLGLAALGIRMLLQKGGKFPNTSVGANPELRKMGIQCAKCEEYKKYHKNKKHACAQLNKDNFKITAQKSPSVV